MKPLFLLVLILTGCGSLHLVSSPKSIDLMIQDELATSGAVFINPMAWTCTYQGDGCRLCRNWSGSAQPLFIHRGPHEEPEVWSAPPMARIAICLGDEKRLAWDQ